MSATALNCMLTSDGCPLHLQECADGGEAQVFKFSTSPALQSKPLHASRKPREEPGGDPPGGLRGPREEGGEVSVVSLLVVT